MVAALLALLLLSAACASAADETKSPASDASSANPLAVRIMNYGKFADHAYTHLPSVGVRFLFLAVPQAKDADA